MKTTIEPCGVTLKIEHKGKIYYGHMFNDFERYKTFGNYDLNPDDDLILFDEDWNKIPWDSPLYEELPPIIEKIVIDQEDDEDEDHGERDDRIRESYQ